MRAIGDNRGAVDSSPFIDELAALVRPGFSSLRGLQAERSRVGCAVAQARSGCWGLLGLSAERLRVWCSEAQALSEVLDLLALQTEPTPPSPHTTKHQHHPPTKLDHPVIWKHLLSD